MNASGREIDVAAPWPRRRIHDLIREVAEVDPDDEAAMRARLIKAGMAKLFGSEAGVENSLEAMRIFGGYSYSIEYDVERLYRDAPLMCIGEGANEILSTVIAKQLVDRHRI